MSPPVIGAGDRPFRVSSETDKTETEGRPGRGARPAPSGPGTQYSSIPGGAGASFFFSGISATTASVVSIRAAMDEAFWMAVRTTLVGSMTPASVRFSNLSSWAL